MEGILYGVRVERDTDRFRLMSPSSRPRLPEGYRAPLDCRSTWQLMTERIAGATKALT